LINQHTRKGTNEPGNADAGRGASSLKDAARLNYTQMTMSKEEAKAFGIAEGERRSLIRFDSAKVNLCPPREAKWLKIVSIPLGNSTELYPNGDNVQTIEAWEPPDVMAQISQTEMGTILAKLDEGFDDGSLYMNHHKARQTHAAWQVVIDYSHVEKEQAREIINRWIQRGMLYEAPFFDPYDRKDKTGLKVRRSQKTRE
jgi:hypothetical protein